VSVFGRLDPSETPVEFLLRHELPIPQHRTYLALWMDITFAQPEDYANGQSPRLTGPLGLTGGDERRWTHEVRIPDRVPVRGGHLQAVFAPVARVAVDRGIRALFQWCTRAGVDTVTIDTPAGDDFAELQRQCRAYMRRKKLY
jgi:hypothetical protein